VNTQFVILLISLVVFLAYILPSAILASTDKDFCYDQVGDGHLCFDSKKQCERKLNHDDIAESPCYNRDQPDK
jgi:hypothetical protein